MKKLFICLIACSTVAFSAMAQETRTYDKNEMHKEKGPGGGAMKELNLTDAQKIQMKANREEMRAKMDKIRQDATLSEDQKKAKMDALRNEQKQKMESILTPEQKTKFQEIRKNNPGRQDTSGRSEGRESKMKMKEELGLSNDQASQLKTLHQSAKSKIEAIKNNSTLTESAKKDQIKAIRESTKTQRKTILTADQEKKMEEMKHHRKGHGKWKEKDKIKAS